MIAFAAEDLADLRRWAISGAIVVAAYGGIAVAMVNWHDTIDAAEPAAAIVVEFAPMPVGPLTEQTDIPPGPEMTMSDASMARPTETIEEKIEEKEQKIEAKLERKVEEKIESKPVEEPPPEVPPAPSPEVALAPPPTPEIKQETPQRQEPRPPAPTTAAPQPIPDQTAAIAPAAPSQGQVNPLNSKAVATWRTQIVALIERHKRYPAAAQARHEQGIAQVLFALDRVGHVLESRVVRSSGVASLDEEALALLRRAQPFPAPPAEFPGERVTVTLPLRFNLK